MLTSISDIEKPRVEITQSLSQERSTLKTVTNSFPYFVISFEKISVSGISENSIYFTTLDRKELFTNRTSRKGLTESITQPSRNSFFQQKIEELYQLYIKLDYKNPAVLEICKDIIKDCLTQRKLDIKISRTGENEILIFRESEGVFNNIIIDADADIEYLHIPVNRAETFNEHYPFISNFNTFSLVSKL